jgi:hypothetical protein
MRGPSIKATIAFLIVAACDGNANGPTQPALPRGAWEAVKRPL